MDRSLVVVLIGLLVPVFCEDGPVVEAPAGKFKGHYPVKTRNGREVQSFEGIPYAMPPVGELRFKDPVKMPVLNEIYDATDGSKECYQPTLNFSQVRNLSSYTGSEDCLYLNVHRPKMNDGAPPLPVMVWVHGGGFFLGSGSRKWNGPDYFLDKDMILVTINYRLGILGFLTTGDDVIPGNFGMKDQIAALKWVKENIASFGGDPNSVTVDGMSAGGTATSLLMHSPLSKGLFHKIIAQSGTAYSSYAVRSWKAAKEDAREVASYLGCVFKSEKFLTCIQKMPLMELFKAGLTLIPDEMVISFNFAPVLEDKSPSAFITHDSFMEPSDIPLLSGVTSRETKYMLKGLTGDNKKYMGDIAKIKQDLEQLMPYWGNYDFHPNKSEITKKLSKFYFGDGGFADATENQIIDYLSDIMFNYGLHLAGKIEKGPTYMYILSYKAKADPSAMDLPKDQQEGVSHGEDLQFFFSSKFFNRKDGLANEDLKMSETMVEMWFKFMKYGNPTPDTKMWEESEKGVKYLDMTNNGLIMKSNMFQDRMKFLDELHIDRSMVQM